MATAPKKTAAEKTTGTKVEPEKAAEAEKVVSPTEEAGADGNDAAAADAAAATDAKAAVDAEAGADEETEPEPEPEDDGVDSFDEEQPLDSAQLAAVTASAERSQMTSQTQAREYAEALVTPKPDIRSHSAAAVARRDKQAMDELLTSGATTPAHTVEVHVGSDGKANGTGPNGVLLPVDRSGLHSPSQDALNPAFAVHRE